MLEYLRIGKTKFSSGSVRALRPTPLEFYCYALTDEIAERVALGFMFGKAKLVFCNNLTYSRRWARNKQIKLLESKGT